MSLIAIESAERMMTSIGLIDNFGDPVEGLECVGWLSRTFPEEYAEAVALLEKGAPTEYVAAVEKLVEMAKTKIFKGKVFNLLIDLEKKQQEKKNGVS